MKTDQKSHSQSHSVSVFFPAFNDEGSIARLIHEALEVLQRITRDYEVIVVNDGSSDGTAAVLDELANELPRLRVINHPHNRGYGAAQRLRDKRQGPDLLHRR